MRDLWCDTNVEEVLLREGFEEHWLYNDYIQAICENIIEDYHFIDIVKEGKFLQKLASFSTERALGLLKCKYFPVMKDTPCTILQDRCVYNLADLMEQAIKDEHLIDLEEVTFALRTFVWYPSIELAGFWARDGYCIYAPAPYETSKTFWSESLISLHRRKE